jgi:hypothetical protein
MSQGNSITIGARTGRCIPDDGHYREVHGMITASMQTYSPNSPAGGG